MEKTKRTSAIIRLLILASLIVGVPVFLYFNCRETLFNTEWLRGLPQLLMHYKGYAAAILIGLQILQVIVCIIPGQPIQFAGSYLFGITGGYLISIIGAVIGAPITFYLSRVLGYDAVTVLFDKDKIEDYRRKLDSGRGLMLVFLIYLIPGIPKDLTAYAAGLSKIRFRPFLLVSSVGRSPGMLGSILMGYFFNQKNYFAIAVLAILTVIMLVVFYIKRKDMTALLDDLENRDKEKHQH